jgi:hypothetical protein
MQLLRVCLFRGLKPIGLGRTLLEVFGSKGRRVGFIPKGISSPDTG